MSRIKSQDPIPGRTQMKVRDGYSVAPEALGMYQRKAVNPHPNRHDAIGAAANRMSIFPLFRERWGRECVGRAPFSSSSPRSDRDRGSFIHLEGDGVKDRSGVGQRSRHVSHEHFPQFTYLRGRKAFLPRALSSFIPYYFQVLLGTQNIAESQRIYIASSPSRTQNLLCGGRSGIELKTNALGFIRRDRRP